MPIASAATNWAGSQGNLSSKSSLLSKGSPRSNEDDNNGRLYQPVGGERIRDELRTSTYPSSANGNSPKITDEAAEELGWLRQKCGEIIDDRRTQTFILLLIALSSIMIGAQSFPVIQQNKSLESAFEIVDLVVLIIFTIESMAHFIFLGPRRFFQDRWLVFDFTIVIISWIALRVRELVAFRVFRAWRFVTQVTRLRNVVVAVFSIMPAIGAIFLLLLLIVYIFAVMFTTLFKDYYERGITDQDYFGRLDKTLFTLFQVLCLVSRDVRHFICPLLTRFDLLQCQNVLHLTCCNSKIQDEWSAIAYDITPVDYWAWFIFIAFVVMTAFVVLNLLIAVICDALKILREAENKMLLNKLRGLENIEEEEIKGEGVIDGQRESNERTQQRVDDMQRMLDEMVLAQENMARTLQYLSLALYAQRKSDELMSIRETISDDFESKSIELTIKPAGEQ